MSHHQDHETLKPASQSKRIEYPRPDGKLTFDRLSSVFLSNTNHEEDQPAHLQLRDPSRWKGVNWEQFRSPESRYCPAAVYEAVGPEAEKELRGTPDPEATGEGASVEAGGGRRAAGDQRAELRPLQDLRHQGPDAEHRLGDAGGRRRAELHRGDVRRRRKGASRRRARGLMMAEWKRAWPAWKQGCRTSS